MDTYLGLGIKLIVGLITLIVIIRLMGNKELAQITPLDTAFIVILGDIVVETAHSTDLNFTHTMFSMIIWGTMIFLLELSTRKSRMMDHLIQGDAKVIIRNGQPDMNLLKRLRITNQELRAMLRSKGVFDVRDVEVAFLEIGGNISVLKRGESNEFKGAEAKNREN